MKRFLVIKTGRTYDGIRDRHGCFEDWIAAGLGVDRDRVRTVAVFEGGLLPARLEGDDTVCGVVITGSPAMVTDRQPWSEAVARWLAYELVERHAHIPVLGICYGHQLIAHAFGGRVDYNPRGREIGTVPLRATEQTAADPLLGDIEFPLLAHVTHLQSVLELPPGAVHLASSALEPHQAYRIGDRIWGVQFHPEFTADIMRAYLDVLAERLAGEGLDPEHVRAGVAPAPLATAVLRRFAALCEGGMPA
ncbi:MAG: glutamine amidotransferase [Pseudomonadota bacterium]